MDLQPDILWNSPLLRLDAVISDFCCVEGLDSTAMANDGVQHYTEIYRVSLGKNNPTGAWNGLTLRARSYARSGQASFALTDLTEAFSLAKSVDFTDGAVRSAAAMSLGLLLQGDFTKARGWSERAIEICGPRQAPTLRMIACTADGLVQMGQGEYQGAFARLSKAASLSSRVRRAPASVTASWALALACERVGSIDDARDWYDRCGKLASRQENREAEAHCVLSLARLYAHQGNESEALRYYAAASLIAQRGVDVRVVANSYISMSAILERDGKWKEALRGYRQALEILFNSAEDLIPYVLLRMGRAALALEDVSQAWMLFDNALVLAERAGDRRLQYELHLQLSEVYERLGHYAQAYKHHKNYAKLKDQVLDEEKQRAVAELQVKHHVDTITHDSKVMRKKVRQLQAEVDDKQMKLMAVVASLAEQNSFLLSLEGQIRELKAQLASGRPSTSGKKGGKTEKVTIEKILADIRSSKSAENLWKIFFEELDLAYPGFRRRLAQHTPSLTAAETNVCYLVMIGRATKEIAGSLKVKVRTIERHRFNIRQKFGLEPGTNLSTFLAGI